MLNLDGYPAIVCDERPEALGEADDVRDVRIHVVRRHEIGRPVFVADFNPPSQG